MNDLHLIGFLSVWVLGRGVYYMGRSFGIDAGAWLHDRTFWLVLSAAVSALVVVSVRRRQRLRDSFVPGDRVIYRLQKSSPRPGPRAEQVYAFPNGEGYSYIVLKAWTVAKLVGDDGLDVVTRSGKHRILRVNDPHLRRAGVLAACWFALRNHKLFPRPA